MAITKIHSIKATLNLSLEYICDEEKTDGKLFVSSFGCEAETADLEFDFTRRAAEGKQGKSTVLAHHLIQAFDPEDKILNYPCSCGRSTETNTFNIESEGFALYSTVKFG